MKAARLDVRKTYKLYIGGNFVRTESGRALSAQGIKGEALDNYCQASRKDVRDAVVAARSATAGWAKKSAYLRGQILYRAAEMLEGRADSLVSEITRSTGVTAASARREVHASIDRLVYFAGWTDKVIQVFGSVNPVASAHFNFTVLEPTGVVAALAPDQPSLLALVSVLAPVILSGNSIVALASEKFPLPALTFAEILATSDLSGGVVNILSGKRAELAPHFASHMDINAVVNASGDSALHAVLQSGTSINLKRYAQRALPPEKWFGAAAQDPYWILDTLEAKTVWHPVGL
jgi:acyl-CoA reductase-like NAD-dependent aldehyde dehydrogenase